MKILASAACDAVFLGERDYLHSTTIIPSLIQACQTQFGVGALQQLSAQFHALTDRQCRFDWLEAPSGTALTQAGYVATFKVGGEGGAAVVGLFPTGERIAQRRPFDEDALVVGYHLDREAQTIHLPAVVGDALPTIVSLNKHLHAKLFDNTGFGKWLLTRLDLGPAWFSGPAPRALTLKMSAMLASVNSKVTILSEGRSIGSVHFSRKKETS